MNTAVASADAVGPMDAFLSEVPEEELLRAHLYALLSRLLSNPPDANFLAALASLSGDASEFGQALSELAQAAATITPTAAAAEYHKLFIGLGRGELVPYGSYYRTGFLHEKPLAELRQALSRLGITRSEETKEPEDHIAVLCEVMAGLIGGGFGKPEPLNVQRDLFEDHIAPWAGRFFADLEKARTAAFYGVVGRVGRLFVGIERTAFAMAG